jgi:hypothetical protein
MHDKQNDFNGLPRDGQTGVHVGQSGFMTRTNAIVIGQ